MLGMLVRRRSKTINTFAGFKKTGHFHTIMMLEFTSTFQKDTLHLCSSCEQEQGIDQSPLKDLGWKLSHGLCRRHSRKFLQMAGLSPDKIDASMEKLSKNKSPIADLFAPENQILTNWLKNPTRGPKTD